MSDIQWASKHFRSFRDILEGLNELHGASGNFRGVLEHFRAFQKVQGGLKILRRNCGISAAVLELPEFEMPLEPYETEPALNLEK